MADDVTLGKLIEGEAHRDAIHIAVAPVVAAGDLRPGAHVGLLPDGTAVDGIEAIGIVDPYLKHPVKLGERFWLCLYPKTITSLRHEWSHPAFAAEVQANHQKAVQAVAQQLGVTAEELMKQADEFAEAECGCWWPEENGASYRINWADDFWPHWAAIRGRGVATCGDPYECNC